MRISLFFKKAKFCTGVISGLQALRFNKIPKQIHSMTFFIEEINGALIMCNLETLYIANLPLEFYYAKKNSSCFSQEVLMLTHQGVQ